MSIWVYAIPVIVVLLIVVIAIPFMKKNAKNASASMEKIKDAKVHLTMEAGNLLSVNGKPENALQSCYYIYGIEDVGPLVVEFMPNFTHAQTNYSSKVPMQVAFSAESGKSYTIGVAPKKTKDDPSILVVTPLKSNELIFKSTFYIIVTDITHTPEAKSMRGIV